MAEPFGKPPSPELNGVSWTNISAAERRQVHEAWTYMKERLDHIQAKCPHCGDHNPLAYGLGGHLYCYQNRQHLLHRSQVVKLANALHGKTDAEAKTIWQKWTDDFRTRHSTRLAIQAMKA